MILTSRERSSMASTWEEFLCVTKGDTKACRLFTGQYEALASKYDYYDEETEDYLLPEAIDEKVVTGINDEYVVGGELGWCDESDTVEFNHADDPLLAEWLNDSGWARVFSLVSVREAIEKFID